MRSNVNMTGRRVWVFGSRVRGTERPDSDLDVAVEHDAMPRDSDAFTTAIGEADNWRNELGPCVSAPLDPQSYIPGLTPTIQTGLAIERSRALQVRNTDHKHCATDHHLCRLTSELNGGSLASRPF